MIEGVREPAVASDLIDDKTFGNGVRALYRTTENDGVFCYTFFKAIAIKPKVHPPVICGVELPNISCICAMAPNGMLLPIDATVNRSTASANQIFQPRKVRKISPP